MEVFDCPAVAWLISEQINQKHNAYKNFKVYKKTFQLNDIDDAFRENIIRILIYCEARVFLV